MLLRTGDSLDLREFFQFDFEPYLSTDGAGEGSLNELLLSLGWLELLAVLGRELYDGVIDFFLAVRGGVLPLSDSFFVSFSACIQQVL